MRAERLFRRGGLERQQEKKGGEGEEAFHDNCSLEGRGTPDCNEFAPVSSAAATALLGRFASGSANFVFRVRVPLSRSPWLPGIFAAGGPGGLPLDPGE
jgi:hypothetical protein